MLGLLSGAPQQRCTGTLCDLFYGGPPPEQPATAPKGEPAARAEPVPRAEPAADDAPEPPPDSERTYVEPAPHCTVNPRDPWACYR